ncbi:hypothetical protein AFK24_09915 [Pseudomonas syringae]|uniref:ImpA N-terminal domain-containing protein n=1 Tax=Pseudomonas syringae TaxID=317 RepID=A0A1C7ZA74_PSESX|nr:type VI secretion system protein TssA [Pseudomonas syringae]OCR25095.1 hypothetical protein AFK24_09915 [Pseudomonas syringae]
MSCLNQELGSFAISATNPAGVNPRESEAYVLAQVELEKLTNIHSASGVDWPKVADACARVIRDEGKDLNAVVWLLCAWTSTTGLPGLAMGIHVLREMLELYWDDLTPPVTRLRARRNQAQWLLDWLTVKVDESFEPMPGALLQALLEDWQAIDRFWRDKDDDGPNFLVLSRRLSLLPVLASAPLVAAESEPEQVEPPATSESEVAPASATTRQSPGVSAASKKAPPVLASPPDLGSLETDDAIESAVSGVFGALAPLVTFCLESRTTLPLLFRLNRQMAWTTLTQLPPAQGNVTRLPPPSDSELESFNRLQSVGEPLDVIRFCEGRLNTFPFWLDLNRASHAALLKLGSAAVSGATSLVLETRHFLARLPLLAELAFADGRPFADGATCAWLAGLAPVNRATAGDALQALIDEAAQEAADGRLSDAMNRLQDNLREVSGGRDRFRLRCAQCLLLHRFDPRIQLHVAVDVLLQEANEQGLDRWEPELVRPLLELAISREDGGEARVTWAKQLAAMDLPAFWRLASPEMSSIA